MNKTILWITRTAVFTALLVVMQALTAGLGNQIVTGSIVNLLLILSVMTCGPASGLTVAAMSPVVAKLFGVGTPFWSLIPFIMLGNIVLVLLWNFIGNRNMGKKPIFYIVAGVTAAAGKFLALYLGIVKIAVPFLLGLAEPMASKLSVMFSWTQLFTALIGGACAVVLLPVLKKAIKE